jgi:hypothetical protein
MVSVGLSQSTSEIASLTPRVDDFGVGWLKLDDTKDSFPHSAQTIFGVSCVRTADTNNRYLVSVDIS